MELNALCMIILFAAQSVCRVEKGLMLELTRLKENRISFLYKFHVFLILIKKICVPMGAS